MPTHCHGRQRELRIPRRDHLLLAGSSHMYHSESAAPRALLGMVLLQRLTLIGAPLTALRESHICGMNREVPPLNEAIKTGDAAGDCFRAGWLVSARSVAGPTAQPGDDPAKPSKAR